MTYMYRKMEDCCDPHRILFKLCLDHHHHRQCSAHKGRLTCLYPRKMCSYPREHEHVLQRLQCDCLLCQFPVWEVILNIVRSSSLVLHYIVSFPYLSQVLFMYISYSEAIASIMYEASDNRFLDKSFVVLVLKAFSSQPWPRKSGYQATKEFHQKAPWGGVGSEILDSHGSLLLFSFLQPRLLSLSQVK